MTNKLHFINIDLTKYYKPGIYIIENQKTQRIYIGQSENVLMRLGRQLELLNSSNSHPCKEFQKDWHCNGGFKNFNFKILELDNNGHLKSKEERLSYERQYVFQYQKQNIDIYNLKGLKNDNLKSLNLQNLNTEVNHFFLPGVYLIENKKTHRKYVGQGGNLLFRLYTEYRDLRGKIFENKELQNDWNKFSKQSFNISILEIGDYFSNNAIRREYESSYVEHYQPNVYNELFIDRNVGCFQNPDWNKVVVYQQTDNGFVKHNSLNAAVKATPHTLPTLRTYLNNPTNSNWYYERSFGRYADTGNIQLVVFNFKYVYLNVDFLSLNHDVSHKTATRRIQDKKNRDYMNLEEMTGEEKKKIPNLEKQIKKALRLTIILPFDPNCPIENEILMEQSSTYPDTNNDPLLSEFSNSEKIKQYNKWEALLKKYY